MMTIRKERFSGGQKPENSGGYTLMIIEERLITDHLIQDLIDLSRDWAEEESCYGYRPNKKEDIIGNRIFVAVEEKRVCGYLLGNIHPSKGMKSIMEDGTPYFEVEEIYVIPSRRSQGLGAELFRYVEERLKEDVNIIVLSTATKNWKAIFHFYLDELGMDFWSARLFKRTV